MSPSCRKIVLSLAVLPALCAVSPGQRQIPETRGLRKIKILYVGRSVSPRQQDWQRFLAKHFATVERMDRERLSLRAARNYDVVIVDGHCSARARNPAGIPAITREFSVPTIFVGAAGGEVLRTLNIKLHWMRSSGCNVARVVEPSHPVLKGPMPIGAASEEVPTPASFAKFVGGADLPKKLPVLRIHREFKRCAQGLISDGYRFQDSPDTDFIAAGMDDLGGPQSLAIGRQANFMLWGFGATPTQMTTTGRNLFLNAIVFMNKCRDSRVSFDRVTRPRDWAVNDAVRQRGRRLELQESWVSPDLRKALRDRPDAFAQYLEANLDYLYFEPTQVLRKVRNRLVKRVTHRLSLDADAKEMGIPNFDPRLLKQCIDDLSRPTVAGRARRVLARYAPEGAEFGNDAVGWARWWQRCSDRLFFSDAGGYRFFLKPAATRMDSADPAPASIRKKAGGDGRR